MFATLARIVVPMLLALMSVLPGPVGCYGEELPSPEKHLGHPVGADGKLVRWDTVREYFRQVAEVSSRVRIEELGRSTEGRTMIMAVVSAPDTVANLKRHQQQQQKLADPRLIHDVVERRQLAAASKVVVLINTALHSNEAMSTQTAMQLLYDLAGGDAPQVREILDRAIVLIVPSANPDGTDMVAQWYQRSLAKPWEGGGLPWLYHKYSGHDDNRDWFMLNFAETRNLTKVLYQQWFPTLVLDLHQMGSTGPRQFIPPHYHPLNPNMPPMINESLMLVGGYLATAFARAGRTGVSHSNSFDLWWAGGFTHEPIQHNMVGILSETASCRIATPVFVTKDQLRGGMRGLPSYAETVNFSAPWPGGWWRPRDIVEYQRIVATGLLALAARFHELFQSNYVQMAEEAIAAGRTAPPFAWLLPAEQRDPGTALQMLRILAATGLEIHRAEEPFTADEVKYPSGTYILYCAQPYRAHLNNMLGIQEYPHRIGPNGKPEQPYDVAGWTLPLQMGVHRVAVVSPFTARAARLKVIAKSAAELGGVADPGAYLVRAAANDDFRLINRLHQRGIKFSLLLKPAAQPDAPAGSLVIPNGQQFQDARAALLDGLALKLIGIGNEDLAKLTPALKPAAAPRLGLYQPWTANMDEGWTRLVLEQFEFPYSSVHNAEVIAGNLRDRYDCIVLPAVSPKSILSGHPLDTTEPQYAGGIGSEGVRSLQEFVEAGGSLVCIDDSCNLPIRQLAIPVRNVLLDPKTGQPLESDVFFCPGSIVGVTVEASHRIAFGKPRHLSAYFSRSQAFEILSEKEKEKDDRSTARQASAKVVARYAEAAVLQSGYLLGEKHIAGKPAVVEVDYGQGHVVLLGFRVQHRAQTHGTYRLLFNAIQASTLGR
jgi:hypothetical protein